MIYVRSSSSPNLGLTPTGSRRSPANIPASTGSRESRRIRARTERKSLNTLSTLRNLERKLNTAAIMHNTRCAGECDFFQFGPRIAHYSLRSPYCAISECAMQIRRRTYRIRSRSGSHRIQTFDSLNRSIYGWTFVWDSGGVRFESTIRKDATNKSLSVEIKLLLGRKFILAGSDIITSLFYKWLSADNHRCVRYK